MDVNGSRFHLLNTEAEWLKALQHAKGVEWDAQRHGVALKAENFRFPPHKAEVALSPQAFRGAAYDRYGTAYWVGEDRQSLWFFPANGTQAAVFWKVQDWQQVCVTPPQSNDGAFHAVASVGDVGSVMQLSGLTVTDDHYLLLGTDGPGGVLVFDLHSGGKPMWLQWPGQEGFSPCDFCVAQGGMTYILDTGASPARVWRLDRHFRVVGIAEDTAAVSPVLFLPLSQPTGVGGNACGMANLSGELAWNSGVGDALALESLPDGSLLVLETPSASQDNSWVHRYVAGSRRDSMALPIRAYDFLFMADEEAKAGTVDGKLYACEQMGNQTYVFPLQVKDGVLVHGVEPQLAPEPDYYPMHGYVGVALAAKGRTVHYHMGQQRWLPLVRQPQRRFAPMGEICQVVLDSGHTACVWHRVILDACIPDDTEISFQTRSAEQRIWLAHETFNLEPLPYLRHDGSELAQQLPRPTSSTRNKSGSWELLLQNAKGRFLEIKVQFKGNGRSSPLLSAMRIYYPRFSYLTQYLPAVYQDDETSAHFLGRYLANVEGLFTTLEERIAHIEHLFDVRSTPDEFLEWLASWLGVVFDPQWDGQRRRLFLRYALLLYRWRGTMVGLKAMVALAITPCADERLFAELEHTASNQRETPANNTSVTAAIRIVEHFQLRSFSALALGATDNQDFLEQRADGQRWLPEQGNAALHSLYRQFLQASLDAQTRQTLVAEAYLFPATLPQNPQLAQAWRVFVQRYLGFPYVELDRCSALDTQRFRDFLARRYHGLISQLNQAYGLPDERAYVSFQAIFLPEQFPAGGKVLADWLRFASLIIPIKRNASRFTVLLPAYVDEQPALRQQRLEQAKQVVTREKPAHTHFEVKLYWALFRVGSARLGIDSIVGEGSRYTAIVLNQEYLGRGYLAAAHPFTVNDRFVIGRDRLQET